MKLQSATKSSPQTLASTNQISATDEMQNSPNWNTKDEYRKDFSLLLRKFNCEPVISEYNYWQVGQIQKTQGWVLHLSIIHSQVVELLTIVIPYLLEEKVPFKIPKNIRVVHQINEGNLGSIKLGKTVSIYPQSDLDALRIAEVLIRHTANFRGPAIPTDRHLGSIVYTRYGAFNPILYNNAQGVNEEYIYDSHGILTRDLNLIPFVQPNNVNWPFTKITEPGMAARMKLLGFRFYPVCVVKADAKGNVIKALYFRRFFQISSCLIKEGKKNMASDEAGRDTRDRLKWQHDLHRDLFPLVPLPELIGYFNENDEHYLVMEFIKGITFSKLIENTYQINIWTNLSIVSKHHLIDKFLTILDIIDRLHQKGYIHRDLTPANILIDRTGGLRLIDMELAWYSPSNYPNPPFQLGTPGFMSPEQEATLTPSTKEDIYAIGAFMITLFTNLHPLKLTKYSTWKLKENILFFTKDVLIADLVSNCLDKDPDKRPNLAHIKSCLQIVRNNISDSSNTSNWVPQQSHYYEITSVVIDAAINGLSHNCFLNEEKLWMSKKATEDPHFGNQQDEMSIYEGWHTGISGPLWVLAKAKQSGFPINLCAETYESNLQHLKHAILSKHAEMIPGFFRGLAGISITIAEGMNAGLIQNSRENLALLENCFHTIAGMLSLSTGIAGQGIALLTCKSWLDQGKLQYLLNTYINVLLNTQATNGSWPIFENGGKDNHIITGLSNGVAGIVWFLLASLEYSPNQIVAGAVERGLKWLELQSFRKKGIHVWPKSSGNKDITGISTSHGTSGIILTFIKAYSLLGSLKYKIIAETWLGSLPDQLLLSDFSLSSGLAGLGEIYLEAASSLNNPRWSERATWITQLLVNFFQSKNNSKGFWITEDMIRFTADLFTGNSGILHFMMRSHKANQLCHPLAINKYRGQNLT